MSDSNQALLWLDELSNDDVSVVGGKNASLGEMTGALATTGIRVPDGFATTASAYRSFLEHNDLTGRIRDEIGRLGSDMSNLEDVAGSIREAIEGGSFPDEIESAIRKAYEELSGRYERAEVDVAVRSSATAEDLPDASFAGQQETYLNVVGGDALVDSCRDCYASLFTDRAIAYREENGFDHLEVALSVGVQKMVRSDLAAAGVMFTIDTETGFPDVIVIEGAWGLGESVVQGTVNPDQFVVFKPLLGNGGLRPIVGKTRGTKKTKMIYSSNGETRTESTETSSEERRSWVLGDDAVLGLARAAVQIEEHYGRPMDIEWAQDGELGEVFIVQARPETVQSQKTAGGFRSFRLVDSTDPVVEGLSVGQAIASGPAQIIASADQIDEFEDDAVLVTEMTDPDWVPIMKRAAAIVTDQGGRTSHAAIVSRELGIPAVVGTGNATEAIESESEVTVSCAEGDTGFVYPGRLDFEAEQIELDQIPDTSTPVMLIVASPDAAFRWWRLPTRGVGLARMEFIINNTIKAHPMALVDYDRLDDDETKRAIAELTHGYEDKSRFFVDQLALGIGRIAAAHYPEPVIVRTSDFKSNEYADLIGGHLYEPDESNPMLGLRGAARYTSQRYRQAFALECEALRTVRDEIGLTNVTVMIPFCRTVDEADGVLEILAEHGLERGKDGLEVFVMAEIPANVELAEDFARRFDGFSIGSNDLTQLMLGVDRDSAELSELFDERDPAVKSAISRLIATAHRLDRKVGICGQAPSDHPEFARFLVEQGIDTISVNPDSVVDVKQTVSEAESHRG